MHGYVGSDVGPGVGASVGKDVGSGVGSAVGPGEGEELGTDVGPGVGSDVGTVQWHVFRWYISIRVSNSALMASWIGPLTAL